MSNIINIHDDFDLQKIKDSGQCFRIRAFEDGMYRFVFGDHVLYIQKESADNYCISCSIEEWETIWTPYFGFEMDYQKIREECSGKNAFIDQCIECGKGLRILRQDPWEMLVTFIISQRKNIPAIEKAVETLAERYGNKIETEYETVFSFPHPEEMTGVSKEELTACSLGYRTPYVLDAVQKAADGSLDLENLRTAGDEDLLEALKTVHGVGNKVSDCIALFAYGRYRRAPVDVWIHRAICEECEGINPFEQYGEWGGIMQQYVFYRQKHGRPADESKERVIKPDDGI